MAKTKKPTGLSIVRNGQNFTCSWKIGDKDYGGGQQAQYSIGGGGWINFNDTADIGKTTTKKSFSVSFDVWNPYGVGNNKVNRVAFRVRGNRKTYTEGSGKKKKTVNPTWSEWSSKEFLLYSPANPTITVASASSNATTFTITATKKSDDHNPLHKLEWKTALVIDCNYNDGSQASYGSASLVSGTTSGDTVTLVQTITEDSSIFNTGKSYTRWVAVRARGIGGDSDWVYAKYVYAKPNQPTNTSVTTIDVSGGIEINLRWNSSGTNSRPLDSIKIEKLTTTPAAGLVPPAGVSWTEVGSISPKDGSDGYKYTETTTPTSDQCIFVRATTVHGSEKTEGDAVFVKAGTVSAPTNMTLSVVQETFRATIFATNNSAIPDAHMAVVFRGSSIQEYIAGIIPHGTQSAITIQCPDWSEEDDYAFEIYAFVGTYTKQTRSDNLDSYILSAYAGRPLLKSASISSTGNVPKAPSGLTLTQTNVAGTIRAKWNWTWSEATGTELSWADHDDAWESTDGPDTYEISNLHTGAWNIAGLATGKRWYVRARFFNGEGDTRIYGPYSEMTANSVIDLSAPPETPTLRLTDSVITADGQTTAYWAYTTGDGTGQIYAEICTATISAGVITYGSVIAHTETAYNILLNAKELGWTSGNTYNLCLRLSSASGNKSDWSAVVPITIASPVTCSISSTSLSTITVPADDDDETTRQVLSLTALPLTVNVSGSGNDKTLTVAIERNEDYHIERPDENIFNGYEGETVALLKNSEGSSQAIINLDDLIGPLDDGASYRIIATIKDAYGQSASSAPLVFEVHWSHQALAPTADVAIDEDMHVAFITPYAPSGAISSDTADIYRLSADKPQLIYKGASFGETYVDPYPALGEFGGHRIVFVTANGDYITDDNEIAWYDVKSNDGDEVELEQAIINFGDNEIILSHNIDLSNSWEKDFQETKYLGGSIQGDWNAGVGRKLTLSALAISIREQDIIEAFRRLAVYTGICNVRTPDGSSFSANVMAKEERSHSTGRKMVTFSLEITRVDSEGLDGMTYADWAEGLQKDYSYNIVNGYLYETADTESGNTFSINQAGELIWNPSSSVDGITFDLKDGELEVDYGG